KVLSSYATPVDLSKDSIVTIARNEGYCTVAASYFSANSYIRNEFGFEFKRFTLSDYTYKWLSYLLMKRDPLLIAALSFDPIYSFSSQILQGSGAWYIID
ncbi:MAG: hypothetical protein K2Q97_20165, partial [Burkholderiaceae bacterium]|nr:hypothetical protein [Burkholderiaceae bacterium]